MQKKYRPITIAILALVFSACTQNIKISTQTPLCGKDTLYESINGFVQVNSDIDSIIINQTQKRKLINPSLGLDYDFIVKEGDSITLCFNNVRKTIKDFNFKYPNFILELRSSSQLNIEYKCQRLMFD
jgi:hypothetical protein